MGKTLEEKYQDIYVMGRQLVCEDVPEVKELALSYNRKISDEARRIHNESIIIDGCMMFLESGNSWIEQEGKLTGMCCTVPFVYDRHAHALRNIFYYYQNCLEDDHLMVIRKADDFYTAKKLGKCGEVIAAQNCDFFLSDYPEEAVRVYQRMGLRMVCLGYNHATFASDGCYTGTNAGLTEKGKRLIRALDKYGVTIDLSHSGYRGAEEAMDYSEKPQVFSHSNPLALCEHARNIPDYLAKKCAAKGGVVCVTAFRPLLWDGEHFPSVDTMVDAMSYFVDLIGIDHVGIGVDHIASVGADNHRHNLTSLKTIRRIDPTGNMTIKSYDQGRRYLSFCLDGFVNIANYPNIVECMLKHGYKEADIKKVLGENMVRVFRDTWN